MAAPAARRLALLDPRALAPAAAPRVQAPIALGRPVVALPAAAPEALLPPAARPRPPAPRPNDVRRPLIVRVPRDPDCLDKSCGFFERILRCFFCCAWSLDSPRTEARKK